MTASKKGGDTALHAAAENGDLLAVKALLKAGADVNAADELYVIRCCSRCLRSSEQRLASAPLAQFDDFVTTAFLLCFVSFAPHSTCHREADPSALSAAISPLFFCSVSCA